MGNVSAEGQKAVGWTVSRWVQSLYFCAAHELPAREGGREQQGSCLALSPAQGRWGGGSPGAFREQPLRPAPRSFSPHPRLGLRHPAGKALSSLPLLFLKSPPLPRAERELLSTGSLLERPQRAESRLKPGAWDTISVSCVGGKSQDSSLQHCPWRSS